MRKAISAMVLAGAIVLLGATAAQAAPAPRQPGPAQRQPAPAQRQPATNPNPACAAIQTLSHYAKGTDPVTSALLTFTWPIARGLACGL